MFSFLMQKMEKLGEKERSMEETFQVIKEHLMVKLPEEIDHHKTNKMSKAIDNYILKGEVRDIVFDFEDTKFMDSSGIGLIMGRYKKVICFQGKIYGIHTNPQIRKIVGMAGLQRYMQLIEENVRQ